MRLGANLYDPESVKALLKKMPIGNSSKMLYAAYYEAFLTFLGGNWERPKYEYEEKTPFIPLESEIDQLTAGLSVLLATVCRILKETAVRVGEATEIRWTDVDFEKRLIYINHPEKRSKTGVYMVSEKCISLIKQLPREGEKIFKSKRSIVIHFREQRNKLAYKLNNPRLKEIHFHTLRHWKATMEAYKTRDPFIVQRLLRHKNLKNTQRYIHLAETMFGALTDDDFTVKVAETKEEVIKLLEIGFTYVGNILGYEMFKKRK